ncbi:MAG: hypothetical protein ACI9MC_003282, partial [Kiritimatiellia bacterium]
WCRSKGHTVRWPDIGAPIVERGAAQSGRWSGAAQTGPVVDEPPASWGLSARGSTVEAGLEGFSFDLSHKIEVWTDDAARIYANGAANQWDPETAIDWRAPFELPEAVEEAVVQVMTYLIENETAALIVPARFLARLHPHFREVMQLLALQCADEARHIEVFTRRAKLKRPRLGLTTVGGQLSLKTLIDEPDFALASFLLAVLGEGSFLNLLGFLQHHAPDPITRQVCKLAAQDEARHVAFGMAHLSRHASLDPGLHARLAAAVERRHAELAHTAGLNEEVFDALILLAAGSWDRERLTHGYDLVAQLQLDMDAGRKGRLRKLGFDKKQAEGLSALHTRNFM